ncbi:MAG: tetratricopeptide repeat protein, partial [Candidatus Halalkalibacterium sp. M3_1C_030]
AEQITKTGTTLGTTAYMAPEQLAGHEVDARSDIWSYGVVLYELFTGNLPFKGAYEPAIMYAIAEEEPIPASDINQEIPPRIVHVIERCLEKNKEHRYQSFDEIINDLTAESTAPVKRPLHAKTGSKGVVNSKHTSYLLFSIIAVSMVLVLIFFSFWNFSWSEIGAPVKKYIAVLPIENISGNPDLQAISVGLAETFSYRLTELEKYEDSYWVTPAGEIRKENINSATQANKIFGVNLAISSTIQTFGDSTRLILELIDADNIRRLETVQVVVATKNFTLLEKDGIKAMLRMLDIEINPKINEALSEGETSDPQAYEYYLRGRAALQNFNSADSLRQAEKLFKRSIELDPGYTLAYSSLGETYWRLYEDTDEVIYVEKAESALEKSLNLNKELAPVQTLLGMLKTGTGKYDQAKNNFIKALEIDRKYTPAYRGLAKVYDVMGEADEAISIYRKAIELKPNYWESYKDLAIHYLSSGNFSEAIKQFHKVIDITPENSAAYSNLGVAYLYNGQNDEAREMFVKSMSMEKNSAAANNLAYIYFTEGKYKQAAEMYEVVLQDYDNRYTYWGNLAVAYEYSGQIEKSQKAYLTAIDKAKLQLEVNPNDAEVLADLGAYYSDVQDKTSSLEFMSRALEINSKSITIRERAVSTYENLGMREEALRWLDASIISNIEAQPELESLVQDPRFKEFKEKASKTGE